MARFQIPADGFWIDLDKNGNVIGVDFKAKTLTPDEKATLKDIVEVAPMLHALAQALRRAPRN